MTEPTNRISDELSSIHPDFALTPESTSDSLTGTDLPAQEELEEQPSVGWMLLRELTETIVLSLIIFLLVRQVIQNYRIESHSMQPNFFEGQFILVNKLAYRFGDPDRGDVIVFHNPNNTNEDYIKRVIALPGDTLEIHNQAIYINGQALEEPYNANPIRPSDQPVGPLVIESDHLFVMGDNRPNSSDSRRFGQISQDLIVGQGMVTSLADGELGLYPTL